MIAITMPLEAPLSISQHIVQIGLLLVAAIAVFGGALQFYLGQLGFESN